VRVYGGATLGANTFTGDQTLGASNKLLWSGRGGIGSVADGVHILSNAAATGYTRLIFGTNDSSGAALKKNGANLDVITGNDSDFAALRMKNLTLTSFIAGIEETAPAAPAANGYRLFAQDNGAGKTQLMVIFGSGSAQQIAIEP
jgi:hypothetical protein